MARTKQTARKSTVARRWLVPLVVSAMIALILVLLRGRGDIVRGDPSASTQDPPARESDESSSAITLSLRHSEQVAEQKERLAEQKRAQERAQEKIADLEDRLKKAALAASVSGPTVGESDDIDAIISKVEPAYRDRCRSVLSGEGFTFSQAWQDWLLYHNHFRGKGWAGGVYVDIGTNDATYISNTLFYDKCLGWRGICFEPQSQYHSAIRQERSCELIPRCVLGKAAKVKSNNGGGAFAVEETANGGDMDCVGLDDVLRERNIEKIDMVNLDIEGMEHSVLRCFPFEKMASGAVFAIETNKQDLRYLTHFMNTNSFSAAHSVLNLAHPNTADKGAWLDNIFVKGPDVIYPPTDREGFVCNEGGKKARGPWCYGWGASRDEIEPKWSATHC